MRLALIITIISAVSILVTWILNRTFNKKRYIKYIPVIIMFPFMMYNFITMYSVETEGFKALGRFVMGLFLLTAIAVSLISSVVFDILYRKRNPK